MRVKAKFANNEFGFYGNKRRYDGDEFTLEDPKHFSKKWMEKVDEPKAAAKRQPKAAANSTGETKEGAE